MRADYTKIDFGRGLETSLLSFLHSPNLKFLKNYFSLYDLTVFTLLFRLMCVNPHFCYEYLIARHFLDSLYVSEIA
jgi:hypothetical protein